MTLGVLFWTSTHLIQQAKTNPYNANTMWPTSVRRTVKRHRDGVIFYVFFLYFFYMENTVQVPSDLPGLKAHGIHWATDVSILETQRKRKKRGTSLLQFNLRAARFFNQIIFLGNSSAAAHRLGLVFRVCLGANWYKVAISHWEMWTVTESLWFNPFYDACTPDVPVVGTMLHLF